MREICPPPQHLCAPSFLLCANICARTWREISFRALKLIFRHGGPFVRNLLRVSPRYSFVLKMEAAYSESSEDEYQTTRIRTPGDRNLGAHPGLSLA
jgi:hypothetical protein